MDGLDWGDGALMVRRCLIELDRRVEQSRTYKVLVTHRGTIRSQPPPLVSGEPKHFLFPPPPPLPKTCSSGGIV